MITTETIIPLKQGSFLVRFHKTKHGECVSFSYGDIKKKIPVVRIHSACLFGEAFHSVQCDCGEQITKTLDLIKKNKSCVIIYAYKEGRGIGLENKIKSMELERVHQIDSIQAMAKMNLKPDLREYLAEAKALKELGINNTIKVVSANPNKIDILKKEGFDIQKNHSAQIPIAPVQPLRLPNQKKSWDIIWIDPLFKTPIVRLTVWWSRLWPIFVF